ncbi:MAG: hypothetical protein GVY24_05975, partial [Planctomycetes bacterium]|nr:hypothetical protein [Planctomycetota bacterium]
MPAANPVLQANLRAIARKDPALAKRIEQAAPAALSFAESRHGPLWASLDHDGRPLALASRYHPEDEAAKLVGSIESSVLPQTRRFEDLGARSQ